MMRLIGKTMRISDDKVYATVYPAVISSHSQLATVDDVYNAVMVRGDAIGDVVFYGRGAGKLPTASAVVADVIDCAKHLNRRRTINWDDCTDSSYVKPIEQTISKVYARVKADNVDAVKSAVENAFGNVKFLCRENAQNEVAFVTERMVEKDIDSKLSSLGVEVLSKIRVLDEI